MRACGVGEKKVKKMEKIKARKDEKIVQFLNMLRVKQLKRE